MKNGRCVSAWIMIGVLTLFVSGCAGGERAANDETTSGIDTTTAKIVTTSAPATPFPTSSPSPQFTTATMEFSPSQSIETSSVATPSQSISPGEDKAADPPSPAASTKGTSAETNAAPDPVAVTETDPPSVSITDPPIETLPQYTENPENIRAIIIQLLTEKNLWYPDREEIGGGWAGLSLGYKSSDQKYAADFVAGKFGSMMKGAVTISCWIEDGFIYISATYCDL